MSRPTITYYDTPGEAQALGRELARKVQSDRLIADAFWDEYERLEGYTMTRPGQAEKINLSKLIAPVWGLD